MPQRYDAPNGDPDPGDESAQDLAALSNHIGEWWGEGNVWHELVSEYVHIDVHSIPPSDAHPYHVLITTGMSDRPMEGAIGNGQHCELMLSLPADWPLDQASFQDEKNYWPIRHLKQTARLPHVFTTLLWYGHTIGNEDTLTPVHPDAPFVGFALSIPIRCHEGARKINIRANKEVHFFSLIPLYEAELKFAREHGTPKLFERLDEAGVDELVVVGRPCVITGHRPTRAPTIIPLSLFNRLFRRWLKT
jgi:hypothetical protein